MDKTPDTSDPSFGVAFFLVSNAIMPWLSKKNDQEEEGKEKKRDERCNNRSKS